MEIGEALTEALMSSSGNSSCPRGAISLGHNTYYTKVFNRAEPPVWVGIIEFHLEGDEWTGGSVPFDNSGSGTVWTVNSFDPLDLSPSISCGACGHHGFIHGGKWVPA